jgi:hypothetical protein
MVTTAVPVSGAGGSTRANGQRMSEREKSFTVSDRRHFTPEGQAREEGGSAPEPVVPPSGAPLEGTAAAQAAGEATSAPPPAGPVDFSQFLLSLGAQAAALLSGAAPDKPAERASALEAARSVIAILEMLRDKTEGRRTPDEERLLDGLLFELRMAFVERSRMGQP